MRSLRYLILIGGALVAVATTVQSESSATTGEETVAIRELLELTGASALANQVATQMIQPMKLSLPQVPDEFWKRLMSELDTDKLVELTIPVYAKYLTLEDVRALNEFYRSPIGRKLIEVQPAIVQESMALGMAWGAEKGHEIERRLREEGYRSEA